MDGENISIHVPRVEDDSRGRPPRRRPHISIHVPRVEDDLLFSEESINYDNFNPRPPCGGRLDEATEEDAAEAISIHVPRVEDDVALI